jgi:protein disulfide-isomerase-like protein
MCKSIEPVYKQLADVYKDIDTVMIARMDATSNEIYHPNIQLEGYPTMFFIKAKDKKVVPCDVWSSKEVGAFKSFIKEHSSFEVDESKLGAAEKLEDKEDEAQKKVADKGESEDEPEDEDEPVKTIVGDNFNERIMKGTHDVMLDIYAPWCTHCKQIAPRLEAAAKLLEDVPNVMIAKCDYTSNDLASLHPKLARVGEFPTLFYFSREDPHNPVVYDGPKYADDIAAYMKSGGSAKGAAAKTAEPEAEKSEPAAASSDDDAFLKTITTGNFKERVMRSGKSSLLKFYAPWCGHCKTLAPKFDELAKNFHTNKDLLIGTVDATAQQIEHPKVKVEGYPTIIYFPGDDPRNPVVYKGEREVDGMTSFLKTKFAEQEEDDQDEL